VIAIDAATSPGPLDPGFAGDPDHGADNVKLWWLGQAGFALRHRETLLLVDPYLSDSLAEKYRGTYFPHERMVPVPVDPDEISGVAAVLITHGHTDHMDPGTIRGLLARNDPFFVVPRAETGRALERGMRPERLLPVNAGESVRLGQHVTVEAVPAAHEQLATDPRGDHHFLGYILTIGSARIYHSGDCVPYVGQLDLLTGRDIDVALLPINGRDEDRLSHGVPGNFTAEEAVALCEGAGIDRLVAHHIGMFGFNTVDPVEAAESLERAASSVQWILPELGTAYTLSAQDSTRGVVR
jgi:L-ascorbate metabolism protein UlaG (beta-lactamase superfamily)